MISSYIRKFSPLSEEEKNTIFVSADAGKFKIKGVKAPVLFSPNNTSLAEITAVVRSSFNLPGDVISLWNWTVPVDSSVKYERDDIIERAIVLACRRRASTKSSKQYRDYYECIVGTWDKQILCLEILCREGFEADILVEMVRLLILKKSTRKPKVIMCPKSNKEITVRLVRPKNLSYRGQIIFAGEESGNNIKWKLRCESYRVNGETVGYVYCLTSYDGVNHKSWFIYEQLSHSADEILQKFKLLQGPSNFLSI